jgi:hypothetical protein
MLVFQQDTLAMKHQRLGRTYPLVGRDARAADNDAFQRLCRVDWDRFKVVVGQVWGRHGGWLTALQKIDSLGVCSRGVLFCLLWTVTLSDQRLFWSLDSMFVRLSNWEPGRVEGDQHRVKW